MGNSDPSLDFAAARRAMVLNQLRPQGVTDLAVLAAMAAIPREEHVPAASRAFAYADVPLATDGGAPIMAPAELGRLLTRLAPEAGERALVIGPGGAYSAAVLAEIGCTVHRTDDLPTAGGPYDLLLVEGAVPALPEGTERLLAEGGRLGLAVLDRGVSRLAAGRRQGEAIGLDRFADAAVPPLVAAAPVPAFQF